MKKKWFLIIGGVLLVVLGLLIRFQSNVETKPINLTEDRFMITKKGNLEKTVSTLGYLEPFKDKRLSFPFSGQIENIKIEEGIRVEQGQILIELDKSQQELNYIRAKNAYETIKINGSASQIKEQELNLMIAEEELRRTSLKAPISGLILNVFVEENDFVSGGQIVARLIDDEKYLIYLNVDESDIKKIALNQEVYITFAALKGKEFKGIVYRIAPYSQNINGLVSVPVIVLLSERDSLLRIGYSAEIDIVVASSTQELVVPVTATYRENDEEYVVALLEGELVPIPVITGISDGFYVVIKEGIEAGATILINTKNYANLSSNAKMNISFGSFGK